MSYDPGSPGDRPQQPGGQGWQGGQQPYPGGYGQQPPPGWGPQGPGGPGGPPPQKQNPLAALFDFTFDSFATPGLIRILYVVGSVLIGLTWIGLTIAVFVQNGAVPGLLTLIFGGVVALFYLAFLRLTLEFYYAIVRMSEDIHNRR